MILPTSISVRLTAWFAAILFMGWVLFGTAMRFDLEHALTAGRYQTLSHRADRLTELLKKVQGETTEVRSREYLNFATATGDGLIEVFKSDGSRAFPSPSDDARAFPWPKPIDREQFIAVKYAGQKYRVLNQPVRIGSEGYDLLLAAPLAGNLAILDRFTFGLLIAMPLLLLASAGCGYFICRRALAPVDRITASVRSIGVWNLSRRLQIPNTRDELQRLAETYNEMLSRLESAVAQIRQFTANASHELRSPLCFARTSAEVALLNPAVDSGSRQAFQEIINGRSRDDHR